MRLLVLAIAILTTYLVGRQHRIGGSNPAAGPRALIDDIDWDDWYSEPVPMAAWQGNVYAAGRN